MPNDAANKIYLLRFKDKIWFRYRVVLPIIFMIMVAIKFIVNGTPYPFQRAFADGNLLLFGAMLVLGVGTDIAYDQKRYGLEQQAWFDDQPSLAYVLSVILLSIYWSIKSFAMQQSYPPPKPIEAMLTGYVIGTIGIGFVVVCYAYWLRWKTTEHLSDLIQTGQI